MNINLTTFTLSGLKTRTKTTILIYTKSKSVFLKTTKSISIFKFELQNSNPKQITTEILI